jgi:hypothetical protein
MDTMSSLGEPHVADKDCLNAVGSVLLLRHPSSNLSFYRDVGRIAG